MKDIISGSASGRDDASYAGKGGIPLVYIVCSPFSGSTLLALLLNMHERVATIGHTTGWAGLHPDFVCSCGEPLKTCPLFRYIGDRLRACGTELDFRGYLPTKYSLFGVRRLDEALFEHVPRLHRTGAERLRDTMLLNLPGIRGRVAAIDRANVAFVRAVLDYFSAEVYVDNSHSPYRLRRLGRIPDFTVTPVYLLRDVRGFALSAQKNYGWSLDYAARRWVKGQETILRVLEAERWANSLRVSYEALCEAPRETLEPILAQAGLSPPERIDGFLSRETHILGNVGTLGTGTVKKPVPLEDRIGVSERTEIERACLSAIARSPRSAELYDLVQPMISGA